MTTKTSKKTETCPCPKCDGQGYIRAYSGIANGVCFTCAGTKVVKVGRFKPAPPMSDYARKCVEWIVNATEEQINKLTYNQLLSTMKTSCWHYPEYPNLKAIWESKFREAFNAAQEERIANFPKY